MLGILTTTTALVKVMSGGYTLLAYYISLLQNIPLDRCYATTIVFISDTLLLLVIVLMMDPVFPLGYCHGNAFQHWILYSHQSTLDMFNAGFHNLSYNDFNVYFNN